MLYCRHIDRTFQLVTFYTWSTMGNRPYVLDLSCNCWVLSKEASSSIFKVFGMTRPGIVPTTSHTPGKRSTTRPPGVVFLHCILHAVQRTFSGAIGVFLRSEMCVKLESSLWIFHLVYLMRVCHIPLAPRFSMQCYDWLLVPYTTWVRGRNEVLVLSLYLFLT